MQEWWQMSCKKSYVYDKDYIWIPATCRCENEIDFIMDYKKYYGLFSNYVWWIFTMKKEIFMKRKQPVKHEISIFYLHFY